MVPMKVADEDDVDASRVETGRTQVGAGRVGCWGAGVAVTGIEHDGLATAADQERRKTVLDHVRRQESLFRCPAHVGELRIPDESLEITRRPSVMECRQLDVSHLSTGRSPVPAGMLGWHLGLPPKLALVQRPTLARAMVRESPPP